MTGTRTLAAAWLLAGRRALTRSFRLHRPRGAFCHRGWCQQCKIRGPDGRVVLACMTDEGQHATPPHAVDPLRAVGRLAERLPPWLYERHAIGPEPVRQLYLEVMRRMSAAPRLSASSRNEARASTERRHCDTLVIGGGVSGLVAAVALAGAGRRVVLVEAATLGGTALDRPVEQAVVAPLIAAARASLACLERTLCAGLYEEPRRALCVGPAGNLVVQFRELVVASGAYDRIPTVVGNDLPGIIGVRGFERLAALRAIPDTLSIGVYGLTTETQRAFAAAADAGIRIAFAAGPADLPETPIRRHPGTRLIAVHGKGEVKRVTLAGVGQIACDMLVTGFSQPGYELQAQNGCAMELRGEPPIVWPMNSGRAPMLVVGEAAGWFEREAQAERSARAVAQWRLDGQCPAAPEWTHAPLERVSPHDDAFVCLCEDVRVRDVRAAIADGYRDVELIKRHTGAATGPCQGKLCHGALLGCTADAGLEVRIPTPRPLVRPVAIADLAGAGACAEQPTETR